MIKKVVLSALFAALVTFQQARASADGNLTCVESLELPTSGLLAALAPGSGRVEATIKIGMDGQAIDLDMNGGDPSLQGEVQAAVSVSRFKTRCAGRKVKFVFVFTLIEENPSDNVIPPFVRFVPPNRFELTFHRVKPNLHDMPFVEEPPK